VRTLIKKASVNESVELDESFSVFKPMSPAPGKSVSNKAQVKAFKTSDQMNTFLAKGSNALHWKPTNKQGLKSGTYKVDMKRGADGKPDRDFIRESEVEENAFIAKAAAAKKAKKDNFKLGDKKFPVTIKKSTADEIIESNSDRYMWKDINAALMKAGVPPTTIMRVVSALKGKELKESVELDEAKADIYHRHMLKALGKSRLPKNHQYTSFIADNGDFVVRDGGGRIVGRIPKGDHDLKERAFVAKAAAAKKAGKDKFELGDDEYPVTIKKSTADKIMDESTDLAENFKTGSLTLDDGSKVVVNKKDADLLNQMFDDLNAANRREMMKVAMKDKAGFEEIRGFAREAL
jgi:hypothetical protein